MGEGSYLFIAKMKAIGEAIDEAVPLLSQKYKREIDGNEVARTLGKDGMSKLFGFTVGMREINPNYCSEIIKIYDKTLEERANPRFLGEGI